MNLMDRDVFYTMLDRVDDIEQVKESNFNLEIIDTISEQGLNQCIKGLYNLILEFK